jgi:hypothetical protein
MIFNSREFKLALHNIYPKSIEAFIYRKNLIKNLKKEKICFTLKKTKVKFGKTTIIQ